MQCPSAARTRPGWRGQGSSKAAVAAATATATTPAAAVAATTPAVAAATAATAAAVATVAVAAAAELLTAAQSLTYTQSPCRILQQEPPAASLTHAHTHIKHTVSAQLLPPTLWLEPLLTPAQENRNKSFSFLLSAKVCRKAPEPRMRAADQLHRTKTFQNKLLLYVASARK